MPLLGFLKRRSTVQPIDKLIGRWRLFRAEGEVDIGDGVTMTFTEEGKLVYATEENGTFQLMNLVFRVSGDKIVTNQPSHPREEVSRFSFDEEDNLIIDFGGSRSWFTRE